MIKKSTKNIRIRKIFHTCTSWSKCMTCISLRSDFWLSKICDASMPLFHNYLKLHQKAFSSRMKIRQKPLARIKHIERLSESFWGARLIFEFFKIIQKSKYLSRDRVRRFDSKLFCFSIAQDILVDTWKFIGSGEAWNNLYTDFQIKEMQPLSP